MTLIDFTTSNGTKYVADTETGDLCTATDTWKFDCVVCLYPGSPTAEFYLDKFLVHTTDAITTYKGDLPELDDLPAGHIIFLTQNSAYEIDTNKRRVRRRNGLNKPTYSQGEDGEWQEYHAISGLTVGSPALIHWAEPLKKWDAVRTSTIRWISNPELVDDDLLLS